MEAAWIARGLQEAEACDERALSAHAGSTEGVRRKSASQGKHWYSRHHMWLRACGVRALPEYKERGVLNNLHELGNDEKALSDRVRTQMAAHLGQAPQA